MMSFKGMGKVVPGWPPGSPAEARQQGQRHQQNSFSAESPPQRVSPSVARVEHGSRIGEMDTPPQRLRSAAHQGWRQAQTWMEARLSDSQPFGQPGGRAGGLTRVRRTLVLVGLLFTALLGAWVCRPQGEPQQRLIVQACNEPRLVQVSSKVH